MRIQDKDKNCGEVKEIHERDTSGRGYLVGLHANGLWLTPSEAIRFSAAIRATALRVAKKRNKKRTK